MTTLSVQTLRDVFEDWRDEGTPDEYKMTVLVTVLKHHQAAWQFDPNSFRRSAWRAYLFSSSMMRPIKPV